MSFWITFRSPKDMFQQHDLHAILIVGLADILITMHGVTTEQGTVVNPVYQLFTDSFPMMLLGVGMYLGALGVASLVLGGALRKMVASLVFGMHVFGILTWTHLFEPELAGLLNEFYYALAVAAATALFYYVEDLAAKRKRHRKRKQKKK